MCKTSNKSENLSDIAKDLKINKNKTEKKWKEPNELDDFNNIVKQNFKKQLKIKNLIAFDKLKNHHLEHKIVLLIIIIILLLTNLSSHSKINSIKQYYEEQIDSYIRTIEIVKEQNLAKNTEIKELQDKVSKLEESLKSNDKTEKDKLKKPEDKKENDATSVNNQDWKPTANSEVNNYLNHVGGKIRLRGTVLNKFDNVSQSGENWIEIATESIRLNAEATDSTVYNILGDRLYVKSPSLNTFNTGDKVIIDGEVISKLSNKTFGTVAISSNSITQDNSPAVTAEPKTKNQSTQAPTPSTSVSPPSANTFVSPPQPTTQSSGNVYYANCTIAKAAGVTPLYVGEPGYASHLDRDGDGIACEW